MSTTTESVQITNTVVPNVWEQRRLKVEADLKTALQTVHAALKQTSQAVHEVESLVSDVDVSSSASASATTEQPFQSHEEGFTTVNRRGPRQPKQGKPRRHYERDSKTYALRCEQGEIRTYVSRREQGKTRTPVPQEQKPVKVQALEKARQSMVDLCVQCLPKDEVSSINTNLQYVNGYRRTLVLDISHDKFAVEVGGEKFEYSKSQFLDDKVFMYLARVELSKYLPDAWIRIFAGRDGKSVCVSVSAHRRD